MPVYEYKCEECGDESEIEMSMQAYFFMTHYGCPECGGDLRRIYSPPVVVIK